MLIMAIFLPRLSRNFPIFLQYVDLPLPGGPITNCPKNTLIFASNLECSFFYNFYNLA